MDFILNIWNTHSTYWTNWDIIWTTLLIIVGTILYRLLFTSFERYRDYSDLGFDQVGQSHGGYSDRSKRDMINEMRRRRKFDSLPPVYANGWFVIMQSQDLKVKEVKELYVLGCNLVGWRGETGKAYVADAYCPHLGAHLGVGGQVSEECIKCPFHGWQFNGTDGRLSNIPYSKSRPEIAKLKMWRILEQNKSIYLWYHAEGAEPSWFPQLIPQIENGQWSYKGRSQFRVNTVLQDIYENGADGAHFQSLHIAPALAGVTPWTSIFSSPLVQYVNSSKWDHNTENGKGHIAYNTFHFHIRVLGLFNVFQMSSWFQQEGPGFGAIWVKTFCGNGVLLLNTTPIEALLQNVTITFYTEWTLVNPLANIIRWSNDVMFGRDGVIWNRKTYASHPILVPEDSTIKLYRKWFTQFYSQNSPRLHFTGTSKNPANF